jgi:hypothetical protein
VFGSGANCAMVAAISGFPKVMELMLDAGVNLHATDVEVLLCFLLCSILVLICVQGPKHFALRFLVRDVGCGSGADADAASRIRAVAECG